MSLLDIANMGKGHKDGLTGNQWLCREHPGEYSAINSDRSFTIADEDYESLQSRSTFMSEKEFTKYLRKRYRYQPDARGKDGAMRTAKVVLNGWSRLKAKNGGGS